MTTNSTEQDSEQPVLRERPGDQPLPCDGQIDVAKHVQSFVRSYGEVTAADKVGQAIAADIEERIALGVQRYGKRLQTNNGRDALLDEYQELLDAANYSAQDVLQHSSAAGHKRFWSIVQLVFEVKTEMLQRDTREIAPA